jgi:hypothetical protein
LAEEADNVVIERRSPPEELTPTPSPTSPSVTAAGLGHRRAKEREAARAATEPLQRWGEIDAALERLLDEVVAAHREPDEGSRARRSEPSPIMRAIGLSCYFLASVVLVWMIVNAVWR